MNWGYKILLVLVVFVGMMMYMLSIAFKSKNEMVDTNYYAKELNHQSIIDASHNLLNLNDKLKFHIGDTVLQLYIPQGAQSNIQNGHIEFLRPSDQLFDRKFELDIDSLGYQYIDKSKFIKGLYKYRISWQSNQIEYYADGNLYVQ